MPKVAIISGYHKDPKLVLNLSEKLKAQSFSEFDFFVYDNSELPDMSVRVIDRLGEDKVFVSKKNTGYSGGNNLVMRELLERNEYDYFVLLNDDTEPEENWLSSLVNAVDESADIGAVTSKLVYQDKFVNIVGSVGGGGSIKVFPDETGFVGNDYPKRFLRKSTPGSFSLDIPVGDRTDKLDVVIESDSEADLNISISDRQHHLRLERGKHKYKVEVQEDDLEPFDIIQNAGNAMNAQGLGFDIGNGEIDRSQYDQRKDVDYFCGAAVLLRVEMLKEVGIFDEVYFNYYEDIDLSIRIRQAGWRILYEPSAVVRHYHTYSGVEHSPFSFYYSNRNAAIIALKHYGLMGQLKQVMRLLKVAAKHFLNGLVKFDGFSLRRFLLVLKIFLSITVPLPKLIFNRLVGRKR